MILSYDGSRYKGWQRLGRGENTIQAKLEQTIGRILDQNIEVIGSGRTDAGVHALQQVANFHCDTAMTAAELLPQLRHYLPEDIGVLQLEETDERFHSRLNAKSKTYRYRIWNSEQPCVFERKYLWKLPEVLDLSAMQNAASSFLGEHDFLAFCANKHFKKSSVRTIYAISVERQNQEIVIQMTGDGFLYNMVRIIVGTLVEIGQGKRTAEDIQEIFASRRRENAGFTAPAEGLSLVEVQYR